jgi:hypothetical protein
MAEVVTLFFVFILSVALAAGAAFMVLAVVLNLMTRTAVRRPRGAVGLVQLSPLDASGQPAARYPMANHDGAASLVIRRAA